MPDAAAVLPGYRYISPENTPQIAAAFAAKADELALDGVVPPGDFHRGWLDCSSCCDLMARVAHSERLPSYLPSGEVQRLFANVEWPALEGLEKGPIPSKYAYIRSTIAFVDVCLEQRLDIEIS